MATTDSRAIEYAELYDMPLETIERLIENGVIR